MSHIGDQVNSLRNSCTGFAPVHFFQGLARPRRAFRSPLAAVAIAHPASRSPRPTAQRRRSRWQSVGEFYAARKGAPLWLPPNRAPRRSADGPAHERRARWPDPGNYGVAALQKGARPGASAEDEGVTRADRDAQPGVRRLCRRPRAIPGSASSTSIAQLKPTPPRRSRRSSTRPPSAFAVEPMCATWAG